MKRPIVGIATDGAHSTKERLTRYRAVDLSSGLELFNHSIGNKTIYLDPKDGKSAMSRTLDGVLPVLKERKDIENHEEVIADFIKQAQELIRRFEQDGYIYTGKRYIGGGHK